MTTGRGRYHDGRTANVRAVELNLEGDTLIIIAEGAVIGRWPLGALFRDERQPAAVVIGCGSDDARIEVTDREFADRLPVKSNTWSRGDLLANKKAIYLWLFGVLFFVGAAIGARRPIARFIAHQIGPETERKMAEALLVHFKLEKCSLTPDQSVSLKKLIVRLLPDDGEREKLRIEIVEGRQVNAFTFPGGHIYLLSGLLKGVKSPEELAGVLAHEIVHAQKRHVMQSLVESMLFVALLNLAAGDASSVFLVDPATASRLLSLKLGRDMEREADSGAVKILASSYISHHGLLKFFEDRQKDDKADGGYLDKLNFISTHPLSSDRIEFLKSTPIVETEPEIMSEREWKDLQSACG